MTKLYFIRHGKTQWNLEGRYQGADGDSPLLAQSYAEIKKLAQSLERVEFQHIYVSPIKRAVTTAVALNQALHQKLPITIMSRLKEFDLGEMEGMLFTDAGQKFPRELDAFRNHPDQYDPTRINGEGFLELIARMRPAVAEMVRSNPANANLLVVSHGAALNALINSLLNVSLADLRKRGGLTNTSTTILETENGQNFQLVRWNDTSYLEREIEETDSI